MDVASERALGRRWYLALASLVGAGLLSRLPLFLFPATTINSDAALYGLMARDMLRGNFPLFTWGQHYMGTLESLVAVPFFLLLGPTNHALQLSPLLFYLLFLAALGLLGRELFGPGPALWAVAGAVASPNLLWAWSIAPRGGYAETLFFGTAALWLTVRILRAGGGPAREWVALGFLSGLGFWTNFLIAYYLAPCAAALAWRFAPRPPAGRLAAAAAAFLAGSLPVWIHNLPRGFVSFRMGAIGTSSRSQGLEVFLEGRLGQILGLAGTEMPDLGALGRPWLLVGGAVYAVLAALFLAPSARALWAFLARRERTPGPGILLLYLASVLFFFTGSRQALWKTYRYLVPLYTLLPLVGAGALAAVRGRSRQVVLAAWLLTLAVNAAVTAAWLVEYHPVAKAEEAATLGVLAAMDADGERFGVTDYENKRLNFIGRERAIFAMEAHEHHLEYQRVVEAAPRAAYFLPGEGLPLALERRGVTFTRRRFRGRNLLTRLEVPGERLVPIPLAGCGVAPGGPGPPCDGVADPVGGASSVVLDPGREVLPGLLRVVFEPRGVPDLLVVEVSADGAAWETWLGPAPLLPVFVAGARAYRGGMFLRAEIPLPPRPARFVRLRREARGEAGLDRIAEVFLYERHEAPAGREVPEEALAFLRSAGATFVHADRWQSAFLRERLGPGLAAEPFNRNHHRRPDRTGVVRGPGPVAFLLPASEAGPVREALGPALEGEGTFGPWSVLVARFPGGGGTGLVWTGFALLRRGPA